MEKSKGSKCCCFVTFEVHYHFLGYCAVFREQCGCSELDVLAAVFMTAFGKKTGTLYTEESLLICCQCSWDKPLWMLKLLYVFQRTVYIYHGCNLLFLSADSDRFNPWDRICFSALFHFPLFHDWDEHVNKSIPSLVSHSGNGKLASMPAGGAVAVSAGGGSAAPAAAAAPAAGECEWRGWLQGNNSFCLW